MAPHSSLQSVSRPRRCFYAIRLSSEVVDYLGGIIDSLGMHGARVRWAPRRNLHLTLRFLGELHHAQVEAASVFSPPLFKEPIQLRADGLGAFPSLRSARALWAGVSVETDNDRERLSRLQNSTEHQAQAIGLAPEQRSWHPHITLGRVRAPSPGLRPLIDDITTRECRSSLSPVSDVVLMESVIPSDGVEYRILKTWEVL